MIIRDITAADLSSIHAINEAAAPGVHGESLEQLAAITRESCIAILAEVGGVVAAFVQVLPPRADYESTNYRWFSMRFDDFVYLDRVAVAADQRGRGIGSRLYEEVERRTRAAWITLEVNLRPRNDGSLRFHARKGFRRGGTARDRLRRPRELDGEAAPLMPSIRRCWSVLVLNVGLAACTARAPPPVRPQTTVTAPAPSPPPAVISEPNAAPGVYSPPPRTKESACAVRGPLPDPACTPGAVMTTDLDVVCHRSTRERRRVSAEVHRLALTEYGFSYPQPLGAFEVDHLIPLELGGDNLIANLWPEAAEPAPGFHQKDRVENYLHRQVCAGAMNLADAQRQIATDWLKVWRQIDGQASATPAGADDGE